MSIILGFLLDLGVGKEFVCNSFRDYDRLYAYRTED